MEYLIRFKLPCHEPVTYESSVTSLILTTSVQLFKNATFEDLS